MADVERAALIYRAQCMLRVADQLLTKKETYARLMVLEMGKTYKQAQGEIEKCASVCQYYAEHAEAFLANEYIDTEARHSYISYNPLGVVLAVMPCNFPFWQVFRFAVPALMAGNAAVLKHASNVMGCAMAIEAVFTEAGFPENIFRAIRISGANVAEVIRNKHIKAVTLTGRAGAGSAVAKTAGQELKKTVLELGGSDPFADDSDLGPQAQVELRNELHEQVTESIEKGARCLLGGEIPNGKGAWYPPTVLSQVKVGMPAWNEELFGPVAAIIRAVDENDAIRIANDTHFGLGAAVFNADHLRGRMIAQTKLNAGCCFVNDFVKSDPRLPFGGIGHSGYGRELSYLGIREFTNIKTVWVR